MLFSSDGRGAGADQRSESGRPESSEYRQRTGTESHDDISGSPSHFPKKTRIFFGFYYASPIVSISNHFIEDLKKIFDLKEFIPIENFRWDKSKLPFPHN